MSRDDDDEHERPRRPRPPSDSDRWRHFKRFRPGTPVVADRDRDLESERQRRMRLRTAPRGFPVHDDETTDPFAMAPDERDLEAVRRAGRETDAPVRSIEFAAALRVAKAKLREERESAERAQMQRLTELLDRAPRDVAEKLTVEVAALRGEAAALRGAVAEHKGELADLNRKRKLVERLLIAVAIAAGGALGTVAKGLYDRGAQEMAVEMRIRYLESAPRGYPSSLSPTMPPTQKGP